jgi:hypothetical protein
MSRPDSAFVIASAQRRIAAAWRQLREAGFDAHNHERWDDGPWQRKAAQWFNSSTLWKVFGLAEIISEEAPLTVRRAMYRGIGSLFQDSDDYDSCQRLILQMRRAGLAPMSSITDPTRERIVPATWKDMAEYAEWAADVYRKDPWQDQLDRVEVFIEKQAMEGVVRPITDKYVVSLIPIRGQCSETWCWSVAQDWNERPPHDFVHVYYIGDHDPSGFSIERSLRNRIVSYLDEDKKNCFSWERLAVTREDFDNEKLLGFPVKRNDRQPNGPWKKYLDEFGDRCVEADAISANEIRRRVEEAILDHIDEDKWNRTLEVEKEEQAKIKRKLGFTD